MKLINLKKPKSPNFSSGPTKKPDEWSIRKLNTKFLGRYHRSDDVKNYINTILQKLKKLLIFLMIIKFYYSQVRVLEQWRQ